MYEVEAKVPLSKADFERLKRELPTIAKKEGSIVNLDRYYSNPKQFFLRIRERNGEGLLNLKSKTREKGIELNQEIEIPITSAKKFDSLLKKMKIPHYISKQKDSILFRKGDFQIELNTIKNLGYFLEIETIVNSKAGLKKAKAGLLSIFKSLGFTNKDFEKKYYLELLEEKRKNKSSH